MTAEHPFRSFVRRMMNPRWAVRFLFLVAVMFFIDPALIAISIFSGNPKA
jgi:hypothetical protein